MVTALRLIDYVFVEPGGHQPAAPAGVGAGMLPLAQIAASDMGLTGKLRALFDPPPWWLHGYYGVPPGRSLWIARTLRHPSTLARWFLRRLSMRGG